MSRTWHRPQHESQCKTMLEYGIGIETRASVRPCLGHGIGLDIAAKLVSGIQGRWRHRSHYHLKLLLSAKKGGKKA
ncbi:1-deoxy-D-xylulose-5-phosphate synthase [Gossypium arboreum]|uniref:1-deoxy-D-xylulose-5-phosphate synthase n=1 Tax=Gossypium arboreum TaxID=29729 RepID=A0A0B0PSB7_GOSAR|nr:1-deoxy-D-xylulose-5-phosphate synthase [Gossypium arboreum]